MLDLYASLKNSFSALESSLRISVANANNFNTPGYKFSSASFTSIYSTVFKPGTERTNPQTTAGSMTLGATTTDYKQGSIGVGGNLDVAITGEGFLIISQSAAAFGAAQNKLYTRNGKFQVDFSNTFVTDSFGRKLFGFELNAAGNVQNDTLTALETKGSNDIGFIEGGILVANFKAHNEAIDRGDENPPELIPLYKLALTSVSNKQGLVLTDGGALEATIASGEPFAPSEPGNNGLGNILGESVESSNVDVARVALDMNIVTRGFSALQGMVQDVNKMTSDLISKLTA